MTVLALARMSFFLTAKVKALDNTVCAERRTLGVGNPTFGPMQPFFDPHVCSSPSISELAVPIEKSWSCVHCGRRWVLEHFRSKAGDYLGSSWILVETPAQALSIGSFLI